MAGVNKFKKITKQWLKEILVEISDYKSLQWRSDVGTVEADAMSFPKGATANTPLPKNGTSD